MESCHLERTDNVEQDNLLMRVKRQKDILYVQA